MATKTQAVSTGSLSACEVKQLGTASISFVQIIAFCSFAQETATITTTRKFRVSLNYYNYYNNYGSA
jgi:hypothetical protein